MALAWEVFGLTHSQLALGFLGGIQALPLIFLALPGGLIADRFDRRYTMVITDLIRFVVYGSIPIVPLLGASPTVTVAWAAIATFIGETITLISIRDFGIRLGTEASLAGIQISVNSPPSLPATRARTSPETLWIGSFTRYTQYEIAPRYRHDGCCSTRHSGPRTNPR